MIGNQLPPISCSVASEIAEIFSDTGEWCADFLDSTISIFQTLCNSALNFLGTRLRSSTFSDFWGVINTISSVFARIAGPLVVLFFIYKLFEEISDSRSQLDIFSFARSCLKVGIASVLVSNATRVVTYILNIGVLLSQLVVVLAGNNSIDFNTAITLSDEYREVLVEGISGLKGFLIFIVYLVGGIALVVCGTVIVIAVVQRVYKIFILIPFAAFSFSTYTLPDAHGHEIFSGYLKGIIKTSFEACIISLIITFAFVLIKNDSMEDILPFNTAYGESMMEGTITNDDEVRYLYYALTDSYIDAISDDGTLFYDYDNVGSDAETYIFFYYNSERCYIDGEELNVEVIRGYYQNTIAQSQEYPVTITVYRSGGWGDTLIILIRTLFPALLAAAAVKEVDKFTGIIVGGIG